MDFLKLLLIFFQVLFYLPLKAQETIAFRYDQFDDFIQQAKISNKPVMIYFTGTGCSLCKIMEREVFNQEKIFSFFNRHFISVESFDDFKKPDTATRALRSIPL